MTEEKYRQVDIAFKIMGTLAIITTFVFGVWQYRETAERDFKKSYWEKQLQLYIEASEAASRLATTQDKGEMERERLHLYGLYHGPLVMVIDDESAVALKRFVQISIDYQHDPGLQKQLQDSSRELAHAFRRSLSDTKDIKLQNLDFSKY